MKLIRSFALAGAALAFAGGASCAADYYVAPVKPGPVAGTPLAAITLQATSTNTRLQQNVGQSSTGKWVKVGQQTTTATTTTAATTEASAASAATAPALTVSTAPSSANTYPSLNALLRSGMLQGGDRVFLRAGYHGVLSIDGLRAASTITFAQMPGEVAQVDAIAVQDSSRLTIRDLKVWPSSAAVASAYLVRTNPASSEITFANLDIRAQPDSTGYMQWSQSAWQNAKFSAMLLQGARMTAIGNRATGINQGIFASGKFARIEANIVDGFSGDALRALGDDSIVRGNRVQNCFQIDTNHLDGFQSFSRGPTGTPGTGTVYNLVIENNKIFEWVASTSNPLRCKLQGIGMFDGMFNNAVIRNNLVAVSGYHGITVAGADTLLIQQNTVTTPYGTATKYPWIKVSAHKNGTAPRNVTTANNTANAFAVNNNTTLNNKATNNIVVTNAATEFKSVAKQDFTLLATAKSANAGAVAFATPVDILGVPRPKGTGPDTGAYESQ